MYLTLAVISLLMSAILIAGCTTQPASTVAASSPADTRASIGDIVKNPAAYEGKEVVVQGKIASECGSGCWFMLDDGTGLMYVDLAPNNFAIPQLQGSTVVVKGVIRVAKGDPTLYAATVATDTRMYP
ncbi:MAG: hypothetical protein A4E33_01666 [Methanoregula sp. PtaB.Bin085]|nr:MAG: hypothetical protein A4E33_01666 [Methanoregula sp. PtaB.Bin085]